MFVWKTQQKNHVKHEHDWTDQCLSSQTWCSQVLPVTRLLLDDPSCQSHGDPYYVFCDVDSIIFGLNGCILFLCEGWVWIGFKLIHSYTKIFYLDKWKLVFAFKKKPYQIYDIFNPVASLLPFFFFYFLCRFCFLTNRVLQYDGKHWTKKLVSVLWWCKKNSWMTNGLNHSNVHTSLVVPLKQVDHSSGPRPRGDLAQVLAA